MYKALELLKVFIIKTMAKILHFVSLIIHLEIPCLKIVLKFITTTRCKYIQLSCKTEWTKVKRDSLDSFFSAREKEGREKEEIPFTSFLKSSFRQSRNTESPTVICPFNRLRIGRTGNPARVSRYQSKQRPRACTLVFLQTVVASPISLPSLFPRLISI